MASLADIPDAFLIGGMLDQFIEWLIVIPATTEVKTELLSIYCRATHEKLTPTQFNYLLDFSIIPHGY
jgi:hypothetical protein